jgi:hypothetical protein
MPYTEGQVQAIIQTPRKFRKLREFTNVVEGGTARSIIPVRGPAYANFRIKVVSQTAWGTAGDAEGMLSDMISAIRLKISDEVVQEWKINEYFAWLKFNGYSINMENDSRTAWLNFNFNDVTMRRFTTEVQTILGTRNLDSVTFEIDLSDDGEVQSLDLYSEFIDLPPSIALQSGLLVHTARKTVQVNGAGQVQIEDLTRNHGDIKALIIKEFAVEQITNVKFELEGVTYYDGPVSGLYERYRQNGAKTPQTGYVIIDFTDTGFLGHAINIDAMEYHTLTLTTAFAGNIEIQQVNIDEKY